MITPTVGRIVWYRHRAEDPQPLAAIIAHVHVDGLLNLAVFSADGSMLPRERVTLVQDGEAAPGQCYWMPHKKGQAAKTEAAEAAQHKPTITKSTLTSASTHTSAKDHS